MTDTPPSWPLRRLWRVAWGGIALVVVVLALLFFTPHTPLLRWLQVLQDETCAQFGLICPRPGRVMLGSPEIYTRERLVDDRLEHINWLNQQLSGLETVGREPFRAMGVSGSRQGQLRAGVGGSATEKPAGVAAGSGTAAPAAAADSDIPIATVSRYRQMSYYRELLRAERTRATLDDRHDIEGNTILQAVFDTTVVPAANRRGFAVVAVRVGPPPPLPPLHQEGGIEHVNLDWVRLYDDWLDNVARDIEFGVQQRQLGLLTVRDFSEGGQALLDLRRLLGIRICVEALALEARAVGSSVAAPQGPLEDCANAMRGATPRAGARPWLEDLPARIEALIAQERARFADISRERDERFRADVLLPSVEPLRRWLAERFPDVRRFRPADFAAALPSPEILWTDSCRGLIPDGRIPYVEPFTAARLVGDQLEAPNAQPAPVPQVVSLLCPVFFRPMEEALLLHAVAEHLRGLGAAGRAPGEDALLRFVTGARAPDAPATSGLAGFCVTYEHGFLARPSEQVLFQREDCAGTRVAASLTPAALSCATAELRRMALSEPLADGLLSRSARPLSRYVDLAVLRGAQGHCRLEARARTDGYERLRAALNRLPYEVYAYSLGPRNATQRIESRVEDSIALSVLGGTAGTEAPGAREAIGLLAQRFVGAQDAPFVVGFAGEASGTGGQRSATSAGFGWIIAPRRTGVETDTHTLETHTLSAVLSLPAWWRRVTLEIHECWVSAVELPHAVSALRALAHEAPDRNAAPLPLRVCQPPRRLTPRVPGGEADITRALGIEVIRTPYLLSDPGSHEEVRVTVGERASLRIGGGRLWRSTSVTLAGQPADRIRILPNMMGIIADFDCVRPPNQLVQATSKSGSGRPSTDPPPSSGAAGLQLPARLEVWTSEGQAVHPGVVSVLVPAQPRDCITRRAEGAPSGERASPLRLQPAGAEAGDTRRRPTGEKAPAGPTR